MIKVKQKLEEIGLDWGSARTVVIRTLFMLIAICISVMAYQWADEFKGTTALILACSMIAYDIVLVPRFPMFVHYVNSIVATVLSVMFMVLIGYLTIGAEVADKNDTEYSALQERIDTRKERIERLEAGKAACIMNDSVECIENWTDNYSDELRDLNDGLDGLLIDKQSLGSYSDPTVAPLKWLASAVGKSTEELNAYILPAIWIAILSIQTTLSAAAHGIRIYRPSLLRGILVLLTMIFGYDNRYVENIRNGISEIDTDDEDNQPGKSTTRPKRAA